MTAVLVRSAGYTAFKKNPYYQTGKSLRKIGCKLVFATTGNNGDQYIMGGPFSLDDRISRILANSFPGLTSATSNNLGFYKSTDNGATIAGLSPVVASGGNELWSAVDLHTAVTTYEDFLTKVNSSLDNTKSIRDLLLLGPDAEPPGGVFLVLTVNTAQSAGGTLDADVEVEEATTR